MSDKLSDERLEYYATLPTQPKDASVFMYEVRKMARELKALRSAPEKVPGSFGELREIIIAGLQPTEEDGRFTLSTSISKRIIDEITDYCRHPVNAISSDVDVILASSEIVKFEFRELQGPITVSFSSVDVVYPNKMSTLLRCVISAASAKWRILHSRKE